MAEDPVAAVRTGDVDALRRLLAGDPGLAHARADGARTLLHVLTDWPGHRPNGPATVAVLVAAGADVNAPFLGGQHVETPLHWAASCDDVPVLDALLDHGADVDAPGAVIGGGTPLDDATAFGQWTAAHRLVERGATVTMWHAATLGLLDRLLEHEGDQGELDRALWGACHGGSQACAAYLLDRGAAINAVPPWEDLTPLDAATRSGATSLARWLTGRGAKSVGDLNDRG